MFRPIALSLFPNMQADDILAACSLLWRPWSWQDKRSLGELKKWFARRFFTTQVYPVNAGRAALYLLLKAAGIGNGDEVLVQAFTCIGAVEPILWIGAKPIYVDIAPRSFNLNPADLATKITNRAKAIIVQHTFGIPADIAEIDKLARRHGLLLIEDCAHALGAKIGTEQVGTFADAAFFSFGRDKIISSVFGGIALVHQPAKFPQMDLLYRNLIFPRKSWVLQQLLHPLAGSLVLPTYDLQAGKLLLVLLQKLRILSKPYTSLEYLGKKPKHYPHKLPPPLAKLALRQLRKLDKFNRRRRKIAAEYGNLVAGAVYLRYPILVADPRKFYKIARRQGIILGRWYSNIIDPSGIELARFGYTRGSCPIAEAAAEKIINLPTYPTLQDKDIAKVKQTITAFLTQSEPPPVVS